MSTISPKTERRTTRAGWSIGVVLAAVVAASMFFSDLACNERSRPIDAPATRPASPVGDAVDPDPIQIAGGSSARAASRPESAPTFAEIADPPVEASVRVRVVSAVDGDALPQVALTCAEKTVAAHAYLEDLGPPDALTDSRGDAVLPREGACVFFKEGWAPTTLWLQATKDGDPRIVRLSPLCDTTIRLECDGRPVVGARMRLTLGRRMVVEDATTPVDRVRIADAGRIEERTTDADGQARFGALPVGAAVLTLFDPDYVFESVAHATPLLDRRPDRAIVVKLRPLYVAAVALSGYPTGWPFSTDVELPPGLTRIQGASRSGPAETSRGQLDRVREAVRPPGSGTSGVETFGYVVLAAGDVPHDSVEGGRFTCRLRGHEVRADLRFVRPSRWTAESVVQASVPADAADSLIPVELVFEGLPPDGRNVPSRLPITIGGKLDDGAIVRLEIDANVSAGGHAVRLPRGSFNAVANYQDSSGWRVPGAFSKTRFDVAPPSTKVSLVFDRPLSIAVVRLEDEFGRELAGATVFNRRAGILQHAGATYFGVEGDALTYQIGGVADAGFREFDKATVPVAPGAETEIRIVLLRTP